MLAGRGYSQGNLGMAFLRGLICSHSFPGEGSWEHAGAAVVASQVLRLAVMLEESTQEQ